MQHSHSLADIIRNLLVGLSVSFVALSLGAALGILSGRGAFVGMVSAGIIAFITSLIGGTRIQCSGPTAPMSAISAVVVAYAMEQNVATLGGMSSNHFINLTFILASILVVLLGVLRIGQYIRLVPNVVISGFMSGIAVLIWVEQLRYLLGMQDNSPIAEERLANGIVAFTTLLLVFILPLLLKHLFQSGAKFIPVTLVAIFLVSFVANLLGLSINYVDISTTIHSMADFSSLVKSQFPSDTSSAALIVALPFALQLALLCYLDTLLTALVIDKLRQDTSQYNKELIAQGVANGTVSMIGGIPGAQATIRSVLMVKEGATLRLAGIMVGVFVLLEMILFQDFFAYIPQAVFTGILLKVGYDVFDFTPIRLYFHELCSGKITLTENIFRRHESETIFVTNSEILLVIGTIVATVAVDLNVAVIGFSLIFYIVNKWVTPHKPLRDLKPAIETDGVSDEE